MTDVNGEPADVVDRLTRLVAECSSVPPIAVREMIENLAHAEFVGACVSVLDDGATVRVSDAGPGIEDKARAMQAGYTTATSHLRDVLRGVGSGFPVCIAAMHAAGGTVDVDDNLDEGTVVTLRCPPSIADDGRSDGQVSELGRRLLAVLLEIGAGTPDVLARELDIAPPLATRELVVLEHRGMVTHEDGGLRVLTEAGTTLLTTLF